MIDLVKLTLDRLVTCHGEIEGIRRVTRYAPQYAVGNWEFPFLYHLVAPILEPVQPPSSGRILITRAYVARLVIGSITEGVGSVTEGTYIENKAEIYYARFMDYYARHPYLSTDEKPTENLPYIASEIHWRDSGLQLRKLPGGTDAMAIDFSIFIAQQFPVPSRAG